MITGRIIHNLNSAFRFKLSKAKESYLWDDKGKKLIDFTSGWNTTNLGWNNPEITESIIKQAKKNTYVPMWSQENIQEEYSDYFASLLPKNLEVFSRETGGANANIMAIKAARAFTGKRKIVGFSDSFHGSLYSVLEIGYKPEYLLSKSLFLNYEDYIQLKFPGIKSNYLNDSKLLNSFLNTLEKNLSNNDVAAVICEAGIITGWGTTDVAPNGFLTEIRKMTKKYKVLLILDEVGTGFSRCGRLFGMELENVAPDFATFAKGMSNGALPIGTMVTNKEIADSVYAKSQPQSTFGWNPIAVAAALKTLQIHKRDKVWRKAEKDGNHIMNILRKELTNCNLIKDINGIGMEIGIQLNLNDKKKTVKDIIDTTYEKGLHLCKSSETGLQIMPPLIIERKVLDQGIDVLVKTIKTFS
jgi:4-aminobutyrate aminotransferase-like enzyme